MSDRLSIMNIDGNIYDVNENFYYVYEHYLDGEIIYVGKGKGLRACSEGRNSYWTMRVGNRINEVEVKIIGYFELEEDALFFERLLIRRRVSEGYNLCNVVHNSALQEYLNNEVKIKKKVLTRKNINKIDEDSKGKNLNRESLSITNNSSLSHRFKHIEQTRAHIKLMYKSLSHSQNKIKGFAACKTIDSQLRLAKIVEEAGLRPLVLWSPYNKNKPMNRKQLKYRRYVMETGEIPDEFDFLILNSSEKGWNIEDSKVKLVIINTIEKVEVTNVLNSLSVNPDTVVYRTIDEDTDYYVDFPDKLLNVLLDTKAKKELIEELDIRSDRGDLIGWGKMKSILMKQGYKVEETRRRIYGKITRLSVVYNSE